VLFRSSLPTVSFLSLENKTSVSLIKSYPFSNLAADDVAKLLKEVGVASNKEDLDHLIKAVSGKKLHDLVNAGSKKLASVPAGGAVSSGKRTIQSY
jgi:ribosomal protein L12E/L44/L45/RPP1/RPP2